MGLQLRNKTPKRRVKAKLREDRAPAVRPNDVWAMDFVHDQLATGRKLRILTVVDTFSRFSPVIEARFSEVVPRSWTVWRLVLQLHFLQKSDSVRMVSGEWVYGGCGLGGDAC